MVNVNTTSWHNDKAKSRFTFSKHDVKSVPLLNKEKGLRTHERRKMKDLISS